MQPFFPLLSLLFYGWQQRQPCNQRKILIRFLTIITSMSGKERKNFVWLGGYKEEKNDTLYKYFLKWYTPVEQRQRANDEIKYNKQTKRISCNKQKKSGCLAVSEWNIDAKNWKYFLLSCFFPPVPCHHLWFIYYQHQNG